MFFCTVAVNLLGSKIRSVESRDVNVSAKKTPLFGQTHLGPSCCPRCTWNVSRGSCRNSWGKETLSFATCLASDWLHSHTRGHLMGCGFHSPTGKSHAGWCGERASGQHQQPRGRNDQEPSSSSSVPRRSRPGSGGVQGAGSGHPSDSETATTTPTWHKVLVLPFKKWVKPLSWAKQRLGPPSLDKWETTLEAVGSGVGLEKARIGSENLRRL